MDGHRFDHLTLQLTSLLSRRRVGQALAVAGLGASQGDVLEADAKKRKKKPGRSNGPRCPQAAAPHWCASAETCAPACPTGTRFNETACRCDCVVQRSCCQCTNGSANFCRNDIDDPISCAALCGGGGVPFMPAIASVGMTGSCTPSDRCEVTCQQSGCGDWDACKGETRNPCGADLECFQPLGGGPTRCGRPTLTGSCGCVSHQQCADSHGIGSFCVQITGGECSCGGASTFCATQA